jgi:hypothetical protein
MRSHYHNRRIDTLFEARVTLRWRSGPSFRLGRGLERGGFLDRRCHRAL